MLSINPTIYEQIATLLLNEIDNRVYFSGVVSHHTDEVDYRFFSTLIINYRSERYPEGEHCEIADIVPVWWQMQSTTDEGECLNDFDFNILKRNICN